MDRRTNPHFCLPTGEGKEATSQDARFQMHIFSENVDMMEAAGMKHGWSVGQDYLANSSGAPGQRTWAPGQEGGCSGQSSWDNFPEGHDPAWVLRLRPPSHCGSDVSRHFQAMKQTRHPPMTGAQGLLCVPGYSLPPPGPQFTPL